MFKQHDNQGRGGMVSLNENNLVLRNSRIPETIPFTQKYILEKYLPLVVNLDGKEQEEKECVLNILDAMIKGNKLYSHKHMLELAKYLSSSKLDECIKMKMRQVEFVPSSDNNYYRADVLFDPESKILCDLYRNFKGMFPEESFLKRNPSMIPFLRKLGLKSEAHVTSEEVCQIVKHIDKSGSKVTANALLKLLKANQSKYHDTLLNDIREFRWVPCDGKKLWKDLKVTTMIASETCKPSDASSFHLNRFCGSVRNIVVGTDSQQKLDKFYKWSEPPPLPDVVQHLSNVTNAQRVKHRGKYAEYAVDILEFINSNCDVYKLDSSVRTALSKIKCAPCISNELHLPTTVVRSYGPFVNYRLEPYIFELDNEATKCMDIFKVIGVKEETCLHHLKECIQSIGNKYHDNCKRQPREVNVDRQLLANILSTIIELNDGENLGKLLIPIDVPDSQGIVLREAVDCTRRSNQRHMQLFTTYDDDVIYSHPSIDHIAEKLGVKSENQRFILPDQFELCPWGQKIELTTEISNLLRRYSDGMAVLKEMVQNAEDAGATVINFMYDERENSDARVSVLTPGMADCQGQALWVYNDAEFTDKDFKNIIKLGEKTKIECPEKIGKFGLGFCSVYNLTDVPIILSGDRFGVFDPNCCHLGELIVEGTPGILLKMSSRLIKTKEDQFKPFQGVFGCNFGMPDFKFNGTLFRLPLRTRIQATSQNQKIRHSEYSKKEMIELFSKFREYIADLLLFTENIKEINFFGLKPSAKRPEKEQTLLFKAESKINKRSMDRSMFLRSINETMTNPNKELPKHLAICNLKEISIHVSKSAKNIFKDNPNVKLPLSERCSWIISNSTGIEAIQMSRELREDGAYALGAVAIQVELSNGSLGNFQSIDNLPNGFSNTPRMFCFLPIPHPKNTGLPLHINGCFMIDDGRQHILSSNTDRTGSKLRNWNEIMLEEVVLNAYFMILNYIVCLPKQKIHRVNYWDIWPQGKDIEEIGGLRTEFYRRIIENDEKVFYRLSSRHEKVITASFSQAVFLEPLFRKSNVGEAAFEFTDEFHNEKTVLMDIPVEIYAYLFKTDTMFIQQKVIFKKTFYEKYFFPNIRNASLKRRNVLLREALRDKTLHFLVQEHKCIPVKCSGDLRTPSELVSEKGPIASMFDECDQRFLSEDFQEFESVLIDLGMMYDSMPSDLLLDRVNSVSIIKQKKQRSNEILRYLNSSFDKHEDIVVKLQDSDFLPVMMKPKSWRLPWKATKDERNLLLSPVNLFTPYQMNLVGCVEFVADIDRDNIEISKEAMSWIGFKKVEKTVVIKQLTVIGDLNLKSSKGIESIMDFIYSTLGRQIGKQHDFFGHSLLQSLKTKRIIKVGNTMVQPNSVAFKIQYQPCEPYLYQLEKAMYDNEVQRQFCELLGIEICFSKSRLLEVLFEIYERNKSQVTQECSRSIVNILHNLSLRSVLTDEEKSAIRVPDNTCTLREVNDICYGGLDDEDFEYEDEKFPMVHGDINNKTLEYLGIMPKRIMYLKNASDELPFGQHEKLVVRLRNLLKDYPSDHSVLNELLQNADDASASEIHFVLDLRQHKTKQIFSKKWKDQQGPALCVFNDARFTENDIEGIQKLGEGSKNDDVTKTGQFGVGFNSVYHITDVPSFLTRWTNEHGEEDGACCIFDPHCQYIDLAKPNNPGRRLPLSKLRSKYSDNFDCYLQDILPSEVGTWFRLPLRNPDVKSEITSSKITLGDLEKLLKSMRKKMTTSLLFLKNVKKISISTIKEGSSQLSNTYYVEASVSKKDLGKISRFASDIDDIKRKNIELERLNMQEIAFRKKILDNKGYREDWFIVHTFGFSNMALIPSKVKKNFAEGRLKALPLGGTAIKSSVSGHDVEGKAFCFLPLPTNTGLPCHVNGHFVVYGNRNTLFWGDNKADVRYMWNKLLLQQTVAHSYASCLKKIKEQLPCEVSLANIECLQAFYAHFPCFEMIKSDIWKELALSVFVDICRRELPLYTTCPYTAVSDTNSCDEGINWVAMKSKEYTLQPCFDSLNDKTQSIDSNDVEYEMSSQSLSKEMDSDSEGERTNTSLLRIVLVELGLKLICTPPHVYTTIKQLLSFKESNTIQQYITADLNIQQVTPSIVTKCLSSWSSSVEDKCRIDAVDLPLVQTIFKSMERFKCVLLYCLSLTNSEPFPFVVDNAGSLQTYNSSIILSEYCYLLPGSRERFLHEELVESFAESHNQTFKKLDLEEFLSLLHYTLDQSKYGANSPTYLSNGKTELPNLPWLKTFWEFLNQFDSLNEKLNTWSLVPSKTDGNKTLLFPIQHAFAIVNTMSFKWGNVTYMYQSIFDALKKLSLPSISSLAVKSKHVPKLVASIDEPLNFVKCLIHHHTKVANSSFSVQECNDILSFLSTAVKAIQHRDILQGLRNLKLFVTAEDDIVSLGGSSVIVLKIDGITMITEGLQEWATKTNRVLLRHNPYHEKIYEVLEFFLCYGETDEHTLLDFYVRYVLPNFENVPRKAHIAHLTFVKNTLLQQKSLRLQQKLPNLRLFCDGTNGRLVFANTFYNPHNEVFKSLCSRKDFPPNPFCDEEWKEFMLLAGVNDKVSKSLFRDFALQISRQGPCQKSLSQSKILVRHLFNQQELHADKHFLIDISKIRFLMPHKCPSQLTNIYSQTQSNSLIEFNGSLIHQSFHLAWTTMKILPKYAILQNELKKALQVVDEPAVHFFVKHLENIFLALAASNMKPFHVYFIDEILPKIYKHLLRNLVVNSILSDDVINSLKEIPLVHVIQHNVFIKAKQVILRETTSKEIHPYLLVGSEQYGQYNELFRKLGACNNLVLNHYFIALACIKGETGNDKLSMEELQAIDRAMEGMLDILQHRASPRDDLVVDEPVLYLPSRNDVLTKSTELIFCDNKVLEKRIKEQKEIVFIKSVECFNKKGFDVKKCLKLLPQKYKLQFLSEVVVEKLDASKNIVSWDVARTLEQIVTSELFQHCMLRLIKSGDLTNNLSDDFISKVKTNLKSFRVVCLSNVFTVLEYQNTLIQNSRDEKQSFYCKRDNTLYVTQSDQGQQSWMKKNHRVLAYAVQKLCDHKAANDKLLTILISFTFSVKDMDDLLETLDVPTLDFTPEYEPWIPELGSIVPIELLPLLMQDMVQFKEGDLAVYEIIDNRFDEDRTDEEVVYVYVKILKICESKTLPKYEIDLGEEQSKTVLGDRLFKIIRKRKAKNDKGQQEENSLVVYDNISGFSQERPKESKTFDDIIEEIEEELIAAWREGPDVFKRVYRRQLLTWHPDKHGNSEESNEITKHVIQFAKDIQSGKIDINSFPTKRDRQNKRRKNKGGSRPWWGNQSSRRQNTDNSYGYSWFDPSRFAENINREYTRSRRTSEKSYSEPRANPQPNMAKVWFRQAENDQKSAASLYETKEPASYNWVCVMCHQAAEKAIKSLQVQEDADKVRMDHSLFTSHSMNNQTLREAAEQLEWLAVHHTRMRYPRPSEYPRTPSDLYTEQMAADCIRYTKTIIETVQGLLRT